VLALLGLLLLIWIALIVLGAIGKGLLWLLIIGVVLFVLTGGFAWTRRSTMGRRR
jgi:hypothetical protein